MEEAASRRDAGLTSRVLGAYNNIKRDGESDMVVCEEKHAEEKALNRLSDDMQTMLSSGNGKGKLSIS